MSGLFLRRRVFALPYPYRLGTLLRAVVCLAGSAAIGYLLAQGV